MSWLMNASFGFIFDTVLGKAVAIALLAMTTFGAWLIHHDSKVEAAKTNEIILELNAQAEKIIDEALKASEPSARPGAAERLRATSCTDCDGKAVLPGGEARVRP